MDVKQLEMYSDCDCQTTRISDSDSDCDGDSDGGANDCDGDSAWNIEGESEYCLYHLIRLKIVGEGD